MSIQNSWHFFQFHFRFKLSIRIESCLIYSIIDTIKYTFKREWGAYKDIFMNEETQWLIEKHENLLERQHANKGKAFSFSVVLIFVVEYNKAFLIPIAFHSTSSSSQYSFLRFQPTIFFHHTLLCWYLPLYLSII